MPVRTTVSYNIQTESLAAGQTVGREVVAGLDGERPDFILLFVTVGHEIADVIRGIYSVTGEVPLCGASGAGVITNHGCDEASHLVGAMAIASDGARFAPFLFPRLSAQADAIGTRIGEHIKTTGVTPHDPQLLVLLPDGITVDGDALRKGIERELDYHIDIVGGSAAHDYQLSTTYQFCNHEVVNDGISGVLLWGDFHYRIGVSHGSKPIGPLRTVTRARGNYIYEIDGAPAIALLEAFIGGDRVRDFGHTLNMFELGESFGGKGYPQNIINRGILSVDPDTGGIKLAVDIAEGSMIRITQRDEQLVLQRTREMTRELLAAMPHPDRAGYWLFECAGRGTQLFGEPEPDVHALLEVTGRDKQILGFYTFGELAPIAGNNYFHNYTAVFVGIE